MGVAVGVGTGVEVAIGVGVAVGAASVEGAGDGVAAGVFLGVGVAVGCVSGSEPAGVLVGVGVDVPDGAVPVVVGVAPSALSCASCAARTSFWLPSNNSMPVEPAWSWDRRPGRRDSPLDSGGAIVGAESWPAGTCAG